MGLVFVYCFVTALFVAGAAAVWMAIGWYQDAAREEHTIISVGDFVRIMGVGVAGIALCSVSVKVFLLLGK